MRTVRLLIGYQGTRYEGWQSQKKGKTLQELFESLLEKILKHKTSLISSSRTDSGVHARGLVAHFQTANPLPDSRLKAALNFYLPPDAVVLSAKTVSDKFHARYSARSKVYTYDIWLSRTRPVFEAPYVLWHPHRLDLAQMRKAARFFPGKHDFSSFKDGDDEKKTNVRHIKSLSIRKTGPRLRIRIEADGYLKHMVRIIVGTLIEVGRGKLPATAIPDILRAKDRRKAGPTAKSHGLTLVSVRY